MVSARPPRHESPAAFLAITIACLIWGSGFLFGKLAQAELGVGHMMIYRFAFASLGFLPFLLHDWPRIQRADWGPLLLAAFLGVPVQFMIQFKGLALTTVSHASLVVGAVPVILAVMGVIMLHERHARGVWVALGISTVGVAMIVWPHTAIASSAMAGPSMLGDLLVLASLFAGAAWVMLSKRLMAHYSPVVVGGLITWLGAAMLIPWVLLTEGLPPTALNATTWMSVAVMGIFVTTCTILLWNWGLAHTSAGKAGIFVNLEPVVGTILGVLVVHDSLGPFGIAGGALIVASAVWVSARG